MLTLKDNNKRMKDHQFKFRNMTILELLISVVAWMAVIYWGIKLVAHKFYGVDLY